MALTLAPGSPENAGVSSSRIHHVADLVRGWVGEGVVQCMAVLVARRGVVVLHEAAGRLTPDVDSPSAPLDAIFEIASITKVLTATALMTLVDDGLVGLNRPVSTYIPEFRGEGKDAVLVRHLLTHTSGLRAEDYEKYAKETRDRVQIPPAPSTQHPLFHEYLFRRYGAPLWKRPGEEMSYANLNLELVADIVCRVTGQSLDRFAHDRLFRPLGMRDTFYCRADVPRHRRVIEPPSPGPHPSWWNEGMLSETERFYMGANFAWSTVYDIAVFLQMFLNRGAYGETRVLSPASVAAMTRDQIPGVRSVFFDQVFPEAGWGFGWSIHANKIGWQGGLQSVSAFGHLGAGGLECWADPTHEMLVADFSVNRMAEYTTMEWAKHWRNDLLSDAVTASIVEP